MLNIKAFQIAEDIDIKRFKKEYTVKPSFVSLSELFYIPDPGKYLYLLGYGVVVFAGYDDIKITETIKFISNYTKNQLIKKKDEVFKVYYNRNKPDKFGYNGIYVSRMNKDIIRIIMLNVGQSVALDSYTEFSESVFDETRVFTEQLEKNGKISISSKKLQKFIGKTLNIRNRIIDNLYIVDSPEETWGDEYLNKIDSGLKRTFDIKARFRDIDDELKIVKENLDLFKDLLQHNHSSFLEWIVILLILVEVVNAFAVKFFDFFK